MFGWLRDINFSHFIKGDLCLFYKNRFDKNVEPGIGQNFKNTLTEKIPTAESLIKLFFLFFNKNIICITFFAPNHTLLYLNNLYKEVLLLTDNILNSRIHIQ